MRHIIPVSGGRDSSALAVWLCKDLALGEMPYELVFTDTKAELPELYDYLNRLETYLGITITRISDPRGYEGLLESFNYFFPNQGARWCTERLKIRPFQKWLGQDEATVYIAIRADEAERVDQRYTLSKRRIHRVFPFVERDIDKARVETILKRHGLWDHPMYALKPRSGCWCCFYQSATSWRKIAQRYPDLAERALEWERLHKVQNPGTQTFSYIGQGRSLKNVLAQEEIDFGDIFDKACGECRDD